MVERRATIKEVEGLGLRPDLHQGSKHLNDRGEFIANYLTFNSSLVRTPNRAVVSCTFAVMACPLQTVEHQVLGDVICPLLTGVAQKRFFVSLPLKYISKRKLAINQKVNLKKSFFLQQRQFHQVPVHSAGLWVFLVVFFGMSHNTPSRVTLCELS